MPFHPFIREMKGQTMTDLERAVIDATDTVLRHQLGDPTFEVPWVRGLRGMGWDFTTGDITVGISVDDETVHVIVFTGGRAMLIHSTAQFAGFPADVVGAFVAHQVDTAVQNA